MVKKLKPMLRDMRFKNKLILITTVSVITAGIVAVVGSRLMLNTYNKLLYEQATYSLSLVSVNISSELDKLAEFSKSLALSKALQEDLYIYNSMPDGFDRSTAHKNINKLFYRSSADNIIYLSVLTPQGRQLGWGRDSSSEDPRIFDRAKEMCDQYDGAHLWLSTGRSDGSVLLCRKIKRVEEFSLENLGYLMIRVDLGRVIGHVLSSDNRFSHNFAVSIYDENDHLIYPARSNTEKDAVPLPTNKSTPYSIVTVDNQRTFLVGIHLPQEMQNWSLAFSVPYEEIFSNIVTSNILYIFFLLLTILLLILIASAVTKSVTARFNELVIKMQRLQSGNFELLPSTAPLSNDELGLLSRYFDEMIVEFRHTIEDNYVKELLIAQAQLKALKQQINPHFLYNTLQSINCLARNNGNNNIVVMVDALANLLHNSLNGDEDVISIRQELSIVDSYVQIQQIRFGDMLEVSFAIDDAVLDTRIPKMTIQPLVENAIVHSMEELVDVIQVTVRGYLKDGNVYISVENNDTEIDENIIEHLYSKKATPKGNGIGLCNIDLRLKIIFGEAFGLSFRNTAEGVVATATIPYLMEDTEC
ncbi:MULTISPECIES: sensor histidine kinase [unclassified Lacrimispora]|uniref:sensor histidine kinase n=1 Tax=unclassified Lacrimispora TaxID=2719232 RepID=UPI00376FC357